MARLLRSPWHGDARDYSFTFRQRIVATSPNPITDGANAQAPDDQILWGVACHLRSKTA